ncbi:MAG: hypothetical protein JJU11_13940 [Candidatus Sumerlaeia bacterium]|nr:hypothetical protein [Candidatus Sumerlaeia bacterium]
MKFIPVPRFVGLPIRLFLATLLLLGLPAGFTIASAQTSISTAFSYQGSLMDEGIPANGTYDFSFALFDAVEDGDRIGSTLTVNGQSVVHGLFTTSLDFGAGVFGEDARWLEISVARDGEALTLLIPRREIEAAPQARFALEASVAQTASIADTAGDAATLNGLTAAEIARPQVSFKAYHTGIGVLYEPPLFEYATIVFDGVDHNDGNHYDSTTGKFTAPADGVYLFSVNIERLIDWYFFTCLMVNETVVGGSRELDESRVNSNTWVVKLNAGDVVTANQYSGKLYINNYLPSYLDGEAGRNTTFMGVQLY